MAWFLLIVAGLLEVVWAIGMKQSHGFTRLWPSVYTIIAMLVSFTLLALAMRPSRSPTPSGSASSPRSVIAGVVIFGERMNLVQFVCLACIGLGIVGLKLTTPTKKPPINIAMRG
ncbi:MAG: multidrug efflux SMR transporter [Phycisphaeraceae bacterium]|nr:multidrug efflux SMR transporter [Phycisphaeraceae bacterium]